MPRTPKYCRYRKHFARVTIGDKTIHLGRYDDPDSVTEYKRLIAEWAAGPKVEPAENPAEEATSVVELLAAYLQHAQNYYASNPNQVAYIKRLIRIVREIYGDLPVTEFGPMRLKAVRQRFIDRGWVRRKVNEATRDVIAMFSWGVEQELVPGSVVHALREVRSLRKGRCAAPESRAIQPVEQATVNATCEHLPPTLSDMITVQQLTGCRPAEVCNMTPGQIDRSAKVWIYRPVEHKNAWRDHDRVIAIGPRAQRILMPYLLRGENEPCFSPREAMRQRLDEKHAQRKTPLNHGRQPDERKRQKLLDSLSDRYDVSTYRRAIHRAADQAYPPPKQLKGPALTQWRRDHRWSPNQLRHARATEIRDRYGLDGAQTVLGHKHADITQVYAAVNMQRLMEIAAEVG
jgi:integrase